MDLRVVPNPYCACDHMGRPAAGVLMIHLNDGKFRDQPKHPNPSQRWAPRTYVGATVKATRLTKDRTIRIKSRVHTVPGKFDHQWAHKLDVVTLQVVENQEFHFYYMRAIRDGSLLAADAETWAAAQMPPEHFAKPEEKLAQAKEGAIAQWLMHHHAPALSAAAKAAEAADPKLTGAAHAKSLTESIKLGADPRLERLVMHLADVVEQRHPVGIALEAQIRAKAKADELAKEAPATPPTTPETPPVVAPATAVSPPPEAPPAPPAAPAPVVAPAAAVAEPAPAETTAPAKPKSSTTKGA